MSAHITLGHPAAAGAYLFEFLIVTLSATLLLIAATLPDLTNWNKVSTKHI